jgi:hypothetical protein
VSRPRAVAGERGTASVEFIWMSLLLLIPFVYVLLCVFDVQRAAFAVSLASRSAARAYLLAPSGELASQQADRAARVALDDQDVQARVTLDCLPADACRQPGSRIRVIVRTTVPLPLTPPVLDDRMGGIVVDSSHVESFGRFRAGDR